MINIDYILSLLDWNNSDEEQEKGVKLAKDIKYISAFIQPGHPYGKNIWDNCAKILAERDDKEYEDIDSLNKSLMICLRKAKMLNDETWECNLNMLLQNRH